MTINWHPTSGSLFIDALYNYLQPLEAATLDQRLYPSLVDGNVTIGVGFDLKTAGSKGPGPFYH